MGESRDKHIVLVGRDRCDRVLCPMRFYFSGTAASSVIIDRDARSPQ